MPFGHPKIITLFYSKKINGAVDVSSTTLVLSWKISQQFFLYVINPNLESALPLNMWVIREQTFSGVKRVF